jgi:hypothetical protein
LAKQGVDAGLGAARALQVAAGGREGDAVGVADGVHGQTVDQAEAIGQLGQGADPRAEGDLRAAGLHHLEGVHVTIEGLVHPQPQRPGVGVGGRGRLDQAAAGVARIGPQGDVPAARRVDEDEELGLRRARRHSGQGPGHRSGGEQGREASPQERSP